MKAHYLLAAVAAAVLGGCTVYPTTPVVTTPVVTTPAATGPAYVAPAGTVIVR